MSGITFEIQGDDDLRSVAEGLRELVPKRLPRRIARDAIPPLERQLDRLIDDRLRVMPPPRTAASPRFIWSRDPIKNAKARKWFFRNYPDGYRRTGQLAASWHGEITYQDNEITTSIENPAEASGYVYGSESYEFQQVPGHAETGWLNAGQTVPDILLDIAVELDERTEQVLNEELERL